MARRPAAQRKAEIVAAVLRLADDLGPDRMTTGQVAAAVGVTQAAVFRHFPTKQDLWLAAVRWLGERMEERWAGALAAPGGPEGRLRALVLGQLDLVREIPALPAILFSRELHAGNEALRGQFLGLVGRLRSLLADEIAAGIAAGSFDPRLAPADGALLLLNLIQGTALRWSLGGRKADPRDEACRLLNLQLAAFGPPRTR